MAKVRGGKPEEPPVEDEPTEEEPVDVAPADEEPVTGPELLPGVDVPAEDEEPATALEPGCALEDTIKDVPAAALLLDAAALLPDPAVDEDAGSDDDATDAAEEPAVLEEDRWLDEPAEELPTLPPEEEDNTPPVELLELLSPVPVLLHAASNSNNNPPRQPSRFMCITPGAVETPTSWQHGSTHTDTATVRKRKPDPLWCAPMVNAPHPQHPLLDRLWDRYVTQVPYAQRFSQLARRFENDHIALRTLDRPGSGLEMFARVFEGLGWARRDSYQFPDTHLSAIYLAQPGLPRVFISTLHVEALPPSAREVLALHPPDDPPPPVKDLDALAQWFCAPSRRPTRAHVETVMAHSQYGAWVMLFGRMVNHFTAAVDDVAAWQQRLLQDGVPMKDALEGAPIPPGGSGLRQTATHAALVDVTLGDGAVYRTPYAYFEIAERKGAFDGFLAPQARQLFEMTRPR